MPNSDLKRARPQLNVYTSLLVVALLVALLGVALIAKMNTDTTGSANPFEPVKGAR
jgi:hypothetical protein